MSDTLTPDQLEILLETMEPQAIRDQFAQALSQSPECLAMLHHFEAMDQNLSELKHLDPPPALKRPAPFRGTALLIRWALPLAAVIVLGFIWLFQTQPREAAPSSQGSLAEEGAQELPPLSDLAPLPESKQSQGYMTLSQESSPEASADEPKPSRAHFGKLAFADEEAEASKAEVAERRRVADTVTHLPQRPVASDQSQDVSQGVTGDELLLELTESQSEMSLPEGVLVQSVPEHETTQISEPQSPAPQMTQTQALLEWREKFLALSSGGNLNVGNFAADASIFLPHLNPKPMTLDEALRITSPRKALSESWSAIQLPNGRPGLALQTLEAALILYRFELDEVGLCKRFEPYTP